MNVSNVSNVSIETKPTNDGAEYTVWVDGAIITGFRGNHSEANKLAIEYHQQGYWDVSLMLENAEEVYGL